MRGSGPVVVLGGSGLAGRSVIERLSPGLDVIAVTRSGGSAGDRELCESVRGDITDPGQQLIDLVRSASLLIDCAGPSQVTGVPAVRLAAEVGTDLIGIGEHVLLWETASRHRDELRERGVSVILGAGVFPGLAGVIAVSLLDRESPPASISIAFVQRDHHLVPSASAIEAAILGFAEPMTELEGGRERPADPGEVDLPPPLGRMTVYPFTTLETRALSRLTGADLVRTAVRIDLVVPSGFWRRVKAKRTWRSHDETRRAASEAIAYARSAVRPAAESCGSAIRASVASRDGEPRWSAASFPDAYGVTAAVVEGVMELGSIPGAWSAVEALAGAPAEVRSLLAKAPVLAAASSKGAGFLEMS